MDFRKLMKEYKRMCNAVTVGVSCSNCTFCKTRSGLACRHYLIEEPGYFEDVVKTWSEEHPIITNAMKFKEVFGCEPCKSSNRVNMICPPFNHRKCLYAKCVNKETCDKCREWWDEEYKEPEEEVEENG
jgi:hypothetical protein